MSLLDDFSTIPGHVSRLLFIAEKSGALHRARASAFMAELRHSSLYYRRYAKPIATQFHFTL